MNNIFGTFSPIGIYVLYDAIYTNANEAASAGGWIYVGKSEFNLIESNDMFLRRLLNEHLTEGINRHGLFLESALRATETVKIELLEVAKMTSNQSRQNPTFYEEKYINIFRNLGGVIRNTKGNI